MHVTTRNKTGFSGVSFHKKSQKYQAKFTHGGKCYSLGYYADPIEAAIVVDAKATELGFGYKRNFNPDLFKECKDCRKVKPIEEFVKGSKRSRVNCIDCKKSQLAEYHKQLSKESKRNSTLKSRYGITSDEYEVMLTAQDGKCYVCRLPPSKNRLHVDHEHVKGYSKMPPEEKRKYVRGLLCYRCNTQFLGRGIDVERAKNIVLYLQEYEKRLAGLA